MKAAYLQKTGRMIMGEADSIECKDYEVLIEIEYTGLCGSDLHYFKDGRIGNNIVKNPHILGHESAGKIISVGKDVHDLSVGDRVAIEPGVPCLECEYCLRGHYNLCSRVKFLGVPGNHGTFREYIAHHHKFVFKLPDNVETVYGAMIEPLAVGLNAVNHANIKPGDSVLITGAGPIGCICMIMAKIAGASSVSITDVNPFRLSIAAEMGADEIIDAGTDCLSPDRFNCGIEASGIESAFSLLLRSVMKSGTISLVGMSNKDFPVSINNVLRKELKLQGSYRYVNDYPNVLRLLSSGRIDIDKLITHYYPLTRIQEAMEASLDSNSNSMKMIIENKL